MGQGMMLLQPPDAAALLGVKVSTLKRWRATGVGPPYVKRGARVFYEPAAVAGWLQAKALSKGQGSAVVSVSDTETPVSGDSGA